MLPFTARTAIHMLPEYCLTAVETAVSFFLLASLDARFPNSREVLDESGLRGEKPVEEVY